MRTIVIMLIAAVAILGTGCKRLRDHDAPPPVEAPMPELDASAIGAVVRVEMGGKFRGAGIAVDSRYVITALANLDEWEFHRRVAFVGPDRTPAKVLVADKRRGMALIKAERPLPGHASLAAAMPAERSPAAIVAYADLESEPHIVELRILRGTVDRYGYSRDTTGDMELHDAMLVSSPGAGDVRRRGAAVFDPASGRLIGMVIGAMLERPQSSSPFIAIPADAIRAFLKENGLSAP